MSGLNVFNRIFWLLIGLIIAPGVLIFGPKAEGYFLPVAERAVVGNIETVDKNTILLYGQSNKLRNCSFHHIEVYYGQRYGAATIVPVEILEPSKKRQSGAFEFGPWRVNLTERQFREDTYMVVFHRCHWLWLTETLFYP